MADIIKKSDIHEIMTIEITAIIILLGFITINPYEKEEKRHMLLLVIVWHCCLLIELKQVGNVIDETIE